MRFIPPAAHAGLGIFCAAALVLPGSAQSLAWSWSNPQPHGNDVVGMAWNGTLGVQVCDAGQVYTSPNLIDWFPQKSNLTNDLQAVTFFGSRIIITGAYGAVAYSDDGVNFVTNFLNTTNWIVSVAASSNLVVAASDAGTIFTSTNGATWQKQNPPPDLYGDWLNSVAYGNGMFVVVGDGAYVATSPNGTNWTNISYISSTLGNNGDLEDVVWMNSSGATSAFPYTGFWTVSDNYDTPNGYSYAFYSTNNGVTWNSFSFVNPSTNVLYSAAADSTTALLSGDDEVRLGSPDGKLIAWPEQVSATLTNDAPPWTYFCSVSQTNGVYAIAGYDGQLVESYLADGAYEWNTPYFCARDWLWQVTQANGLYVAVGDNARIMTSGDGADWTIEEVAATNSVSYTNTVFLCVGGTTNLLIAAGNAGSLALSPNTLVPVLETNAGGGVFTNNASALGVSWYPQPAPGTTNDLAGMGVCSNKFYLVGGYGTLLSSYNGTNWSKQTSGVTNDLSAITAFTNGLLVAAGDAGTILTSLNGTNWGKQVSGTTNGLYRVHSLNDRLLIVGENGTLLTSTNGTNWVALSSGVTNWLNDAILISNTCYVIGNQGVVLASTNFSTNYANWTGIGTITTKALESAATQNGQLVVVGFEGSILRSQVVPVTTPVNFTEYAQSGGYNVFSVAGTVDQQFTLDSSTNLVDWVTGPLLDLIYGDGSLIFYQSAPASPSPPQFYRCTLVP